MKIKRIMPAFFAALLVLSTFTAVSLAAGGIEFTAELKADETWIPPKGIVNFTVTIENTGSVDIDRFEIIMPDAKLVGEYDSLPAGESADVQLIEIDFLKPGEYPVSLFVVGYHGSDSWTVQTSEVVITVSKDPKPASTPAPEISPAASGAPEPAASVAAEPTAAVPTEAVAAASDTAFETNFIYIVIGVLGALAVAVIAAVIVVASRRNKSARKA